MQAINVAGFTVILHPMPSPIATVRVMVNAGSYHELVPGTAHFLEHMFFKGTELRGYEELNRLLASIGDSNAFTSQDLTAFYIDTTGNHVLRAFDLLVEMMFRPALDPAEMDKERTVILEEFQSRQDAPNNFFFDNSMEFLLGEKLGHEIVGTESTITGMSRDTLTDFRDAHYNRSNIAFVLVGNIASVTPSKLAAILEPYSNMPFGSANSVPVVPMTMGTPETPMGLKFKHVTKQAWLSLWTPGFSDREAYDIFDAPNVLNDALGGGMHSLLFNRIREELGLAYTTGVMNVSSWGNALTGSYALLNSENVKQCKDEILKVIQKVASEGVPQNILEASLSHFEFCLAQEAQTPSGYAGAYTCGYFQNPETGGYEERIRRLHAAQSDMPEMIRECAKRLSSGLTVTVMNG